MLHCSNRSHLKRKQDNIEPVRDNPIKRSKTKKAIEEQKAVFDVFKTSVITFIEKTKKECQDKKISRDKFLGRGDDSQEEDGIDYMREEDYETCNIEYYADDESEYSAFYLDFEGNEDGDFDPLFQRRLTFSMFDLSNRDTSPDKDHHVRMSHAIEVNPEKRILRTQKQSFKECTCFDVRTMKKCSEALYAKGKCRKHYDSFRFHKKKILSKMDKHGKRICIFLVNPHLPHFVTKKKKRGLILLSHSSLSV